MLPGGPQCTCESFTLFTNLPGKLYDPRFTDKETGAQKDHCCIKVTAKEQLNGILSLVFSLQKECGWQSTNWSEAPPQPHPWWLYELWPLKCLVSFSSMTGSLNLFSATWKWKVKVAQFVSNSLRPHGLYSPWNSPGQNTRVGSFSLLQGNLPNPGIKPRSPTSQVGSLPAEPQEKPKNTGVSSLSLLQWIFPTQELNRSLLHCRRTLYQLSYQGSPFSQLRASKIDRWQISCVCVCVLVKW